MTSADRNDDLVTAREKLEWVTPQISLMGTDDTQGKPTIGGDETTVTSQSSVVLEQIGPS